MKVKVAIGVLLLALLSASRMAGAAGSWSELLKHESGLIVVANASDRLMAVQPQTGQPAWKIKMRGAAGRLLVSTPELIIASDLSKGRIDAVSAADGTIRWEKTGLGELLAAPVLAGSMLLVRIGGDQARLEAFDTSSGKPLWQLAGNTVDVTPAASQTLLVTVQEGGKDAPATLAISQVGLDDGRIRWTSEAVPGTIERMQVSGDLLVVTSKVTGAAAPSPSPGVAAAPSTDVLHTSVFSALDGKLRWTRDFPAAEYETPQVFDSWMAVRRVPEKPSSETEPAVRPLGGIEMLRLDTGATAWSRAIGPHDVPEGSTVAVGPLVDGLLYATVDMPTLGTFQVFGLDPATGTEVGPYEQKGTLKSPLIPVQGRLLLQYEAAAPTPAPSPVPASAEAGMTLVALEPATLKPAWTVPLTREGIKEGTRPLPASLPSGSAILVNDAGKLLALDAASGDKKWELSVRDIAVGPTVVDTLILAGTAEQRLVAHELATGNRVWQQNTKLWFAEKKLPNLLGNILLTFLIIWFIYHARRGRRMYIRRLAGLSALDEAVGRATEMGKPVLYLTGLADVDDIQTLSSLSILGHVARKTAEYETPILVPCCRSVVMSTAQEVVKEAHMKAGRPDTFMRENIRYLSDDQFGFVAGVDGIMLRDKPAANFYMGMFYAESLILAETGHSTGAIQIAGTAAAAQLPFFVAACDYTLIGEELYAASAYLSQDPLQVGSLKGQDWAKAVVMGVIALFCLAYNFAPGLDIKSWLSP